MCVVYYVQTSIVMCMVCKKWGLFKHVRLLLQNYNIRWGQEKRKPLSTVYGQVQKKCPPQCSATLIINHINGNNHFNLSSQAHRMNLIPKYFVKMLNVLFRSAAVCLVGSFLW